MSQRLLVIDDEPAFGTFVRRVAEKLGFAIEVTTQGRDFMAAYERFDPTVIVLDMAMPEQDGIELLTWLAAQNCTARIIIVTGFDPHYAGMAATIASSRGLPRVSTLTKPIGVAELRQALSAE